MLLRLNVHANHLRSQQVWDGPKHLYFYNVPRDFPGGAVVKNPPARASLVAQWLGVCLLMQGTRVRALVWEDPTCHGAAGPVSHNC